MKVLILILIFQRRIHSIFIDSKIRQLLISFLLFTSLSPNVGFTAPEQNSNVRESDAFRTGVFNLLSSRANLHLSYNPAGRSHHGYIKHHHGGMGGSSGDVGEVPMT